MSQQHMSNIETEYGVRLSVGASSFYDPESKCNLFLSTPFYLFNHAPTRAIIKGVQSGRLTDLKGNIGSLEASGIPTNISALKAEMIEEKDKESKSKKSKDKE